MPTGPAPIPFSSSQASGMQELAGGSPYVINAFVDELGSIRQRPGIVAWTGFQSTIPNAFTVSGMHSLLTDLIYVTEDSADYRKIYRVRPYLDTPTATVMSTAVTTTRLAGSKRPTFAATGTRLVIAGGGVMQKLGSADAVSARLGGSPPECTHVAATAQRLIVDDKSSTSGRGNLRWSGFGEASGHESWDALDFREAEARPDPLVAVHDNTNELFAFGSETLQVHSPDPFTGFEPGRTINLGVSAPYTIIKVDDEFAWLDQRRRFVMSDGRSVSTDMTKPMASTFKGLSTIDDGFGFRAQLGQMDALFWRFPTESRAFVWNNTVPHWSEWRGYSNGAWTALAITSGFYWPEREETLVGLDTGQIAKLSFDTYTDLGATLKVEIVTGHVDHGTQNLKNCMVARFRFKRGQVTSAPTVMISYRDGLGAWKVAKALSLGSTGDYNPVVEIRSLGTYRQRQWKLEFSDNAELVFAGAEETFEVLSN